MRYALLSDIHANLEALEAVLGELRKEAVDEYLSVGDIIGYGADPAGCIGIVKSLRPAALVAGNHEWGVTGLLGLDYFNEYTRAAVEWTKNELGRAEIDYLRSFKLTYEAELFMVVHGAVPYPERFPYIMDSNDAVRTMNAMKRSVCFVGHTHVPEIYYSDGDSIRKSSGSAVKIENGRKYVINVGSVGQPRDVDPRASFAVFDSNEGVVELRRVGYDIEKAKAKILKAGLPEMLALRLSEGR